MTAVFWNASLPKFPIVTDNSYCNDTFSTIVASRQLTKGILLWNETRKTEGSCSIPPPLPGFLILQTLDVNFDRNETRYSFP